MWIGSKVENYLRDVENQCETLKFEGRKCEGKIGQIWWKSKKKLKKTQRKY